MEPKHKFNGGRGATLCNKCNKIISEGMTEDLFCEECSGEVVTKYKLVRHDGLEKNANNILWIEWNSDRTFKEKHDHPELGRSLVLDFAYGNYQWLTTQVTEILESNDSVIRFKTKNSEYSLYTRNISQNSSKELQTD